MKLVVGLGNPGRRYQGTRHNVGFLVLEALAKEHGAGRRKQQFQGETSEVTLAAARCLLLWPHTLMNLSGGSVLAARDFYKLDLADLLIVCDDFNLPLGKLRARTAGSSGGQKGLENIVHRLGTDQVPRLRIGIGPVTGSGDAADFVLGRFRKDEQAEIELAVVRGAEAVVVWANQGIETCMNRFNG